MNSIELGDFQNERINLQLWINSLLNCTRICNKPTRLIHLYSVGEFATLANKILCCKDVSLEVLNSLANASWDITCRTMKAID
jgi:hypothetical protein